MGGWALQDLGAAERWCSQPGEQQVQRKEVRDFLGGCHLSEFAVFLFVI